MQELAPIILPLVCIVGALIGGMFYLVEKAFKVFKESLNKIEKEIRGE